MYMTHNSYYPMSFPPKENFLDETLAVKYPNSRTIGKLVPKQCNVGYFLLLLLLLSLLFVSCQHLCKWYHSSIQIYNYIRHKSTNINSNLELECNVVAMRPVSWLLCPALQDKYSAAVHCADHHTDTHSTLHYLGYTCQHDIPASLCCFSNGNRVSKEATFLASQHFSGRLSSQLCC